MIYGSYLYDLTTLHKMLTQLGYTHTLIGKRWGQVKKVELEKDYGIVVCESVEKAKRVEAKVLFIVDSKPALLDTNADQSLFVKFKTDKAFCSRLKKLIDPTPMQLIIKEHSLAEIVDRITTKSILTDVQTLVNKVNPYDLRKKIHNLLITYIYGACPYSEVSHLLSSNDKLSSLLALSKDERIKTIRNAVIEYKKIKDEESLAKKYGIHTFEILYIYNSYSKLGESNDNKTK